MSTASKSQKSIDALLTSEKIKIDGVLNESDWSMADIATDFTTVSPTFGDRPKHKTYVKVLYDDEAIYISAEMEDIHKDSIMTEFTQRDRLGNTDFFEVLIDTYGNGTDGIQFIVGASGTQVDAKKENNGNEDDSWDAVWFSAVKLNDFGWVCEMKLPYSALRFPKKDVQEWVINFTRRQARNNVHGFWSPLDPTVNGIFTQSGILKNIKNIKPPVRLSVSPYLSVYAVNNKDGGESTTGFSYNGGMDLKYGINDAFTLDMTLVPDFGQVESDDNIINLSAFEQRFDEKRPFFTEGLEMFEKAGIFYTRRVGGTPLNYYSVDDGLAENETVEQNPRIPQLYNATKISGRNSNGLGIGVFNAVEASTFAVVRNTENEERRMEETQPLTNYNVIVFDQNLNNNSSVSLINTNVWRQGREFYDANVTGLEFNLKNKEQSYSIAGEAALSVQSFDDSENNVGHKMALEFSKISGNFNFDIGYAEESPNYNPNDLGFLRAANERGVGLGATYGIYKPFLSFNRANFWGYYNYSRIIDPNEFTSMHFNAGFWTEAKSFWNYNMWMNYRPDSYDYFEPRTPGRFVRTPDYYNTGVWIGSDERKKLRVSGSAFIYNVEEEGRWGYEFGLNPRYRFSDRFSFEFDITLENQFDDTGFVDNIDDVIFFGQRDRLIVENLVGANYNFSSTMGINLRVRHYWDKTVYQSFHELGLEGELLDTDFSGSYDFVGSFFNIDLNFNWRFSPGSDLFINWKNSIVGDEDNELFNQHYFNSFNNFSNYLQQNSLSIRLVYYLDYLNVKKWL